MRISSPALAVVAMLAALPVAAQDGQAPQTGQTQETTPGAALSMGEPVAPGQGPGAPYVKTEHGDWAIRCIRTESGKDPCQLYQLLKDSKGNNVAEFVLFPLIPAQGEAVAGGNIVAPLETLLTEGVTFAIDSNEARRFPFLFCAEVGCVSRIGFTQADIDRLKGGAAGKVGIVPVVAVDQKVDLTLSLKGFTAGYDQLVTETQALAAEGAAQGQGGN